MSVKDVLNQLQKLYGPGIGSVGGGYSDPARIPTGIFPLDFALGGGFPRARMSMIYGLESSGKSLVLYKLMAQVQSEGKAAVLIDVEGTYDPVWAKLLGVDTEKLVYIMPSTAEEAVDAVDGMMHSKEVGLVGLDSIAALCTSREVESEAEKQAVAGASLVVGKMVRKVTSAINSQRKAGHAATFIGVNQVRSKVGVMYGDPEYYPGGNSLKFCHSMVIRLYGKNKIVKEVDPDAPAFREISGVVKKYKVPIFASSFTYDICLIPNNGMGVGDVDSWNTVSTYAKKTGVLGKLDKGGWKCCGHTFKTLEAVKEKYFDDPLFASGLQMQVIQRTKTL